MCAFHGAYMEAREQLLGVSSFSAMGSKDASQVGGQDYASTFIY